MSFEGNESISSWGLIDLSENFCDSSSIDTSEVITSKTPLSIERNICNNIHNGEKISIEKCEEIANCVSNFNDKHDDGNGNYEIIGTSNEDRIEGGKNDFNIWLTEMENFARTLKSRGYSSNQVAKLCLSAHQGKSKMPPLPRTIVTTNIDITRNL